jgi:hypothetical protein
MPLKSNVPVMSAVKVTVTASSWPCQLPLESTTAPVGDSACTEGFSHNG